MKRNILFLFFLVCFFTGNGKEFVRTKEPVKQSYLFNEFAITNSLKYSFHYDSIHRFNFKYYDKKRGFKPFIAPLFLISTGTSIHFMKETKHNFQDFAQTNFAYNGNLDDYLRFAPLAGVYALNAAGIKGKNNFGNRTALALKSFLLNDFIVIKLKNYSNVKRPNGDLRSFPSGHTSVTFAMAHFMHKEYGEISAWYSIGAYACATTVGIMRVAKNAHWISDVITGAGIGILSTELVYLTHLYVWDKTHLKNFQILPFSFQKQKGLTAVYTF